MAVGGVCQGVERAVRLHVYASVRFSDYRKRKFFSIYVSASGRKYVHVRGRMGSGVEFLRVRNHAVVDTGSTGERVDGESGEEERDDERESRYGSHDAVSDDEFGFGAHNCNVKNL